MSEPLTPEQAERLLRAAAAVAASPPRKRARYVTSAGVYWPLVTELRDALDAADIPWRPAAWLGKR